MRAYSRAYGLRALADLIGVRRVNLCGAAEGRDSQFLGFHQVLSLVIFFNLRPLLYRVVEVKSSE